MKKNKNTTKRTRAVGTEEYVNKRTEKTEEHQVIQMTSADFNFNKIWLGHILQSLNITGNKKLKVFNYLLENKDYENRIIATQRIIAEELKISKTTVNTTIQALKESDFLSEIQRGVYKLNSNVIFKDYKKSTLNILLKYNKEKPNKNDDNLGLSDKVY